MNSNHLQGAEVEVIDVQSGGIQNGAGANIDGNLDHIVFFPNASASLMNKERWTLTA